jgi:RHS repeat-associated protein
MNLLKAWNAIAARAKSQPEPLKRKRRSSRRPLVEQLEDRRLMAIVGVEQPIEGGHADGDELQPDPGDDVPSGTPQCFPCDPGIVNNAPQMTGGAADSADVSPSGSVLYGSGDTQLSGPAMSVSNVAEIFGQSLVYSNDWFSQSGAGASLYIPGAFASGTVYHVDMPVNNPGASMFGNGWSSPYLPLLFEVAAGTSDWNFTPFIDHFYAPDGPPAEHGTDGTDLHHEWYWEGDGTDHGGSKIILVNGSLTEIFDKGDGGTYTAEFYTPDKLTFADGQYVLVDAAGTSFRFHNFNFNPADYLPGMTTPDYQRQMGQLLSITDAGGNAATMTYDSSSRLNAVDVNAGSTLVNVYKFSYDPVASNLCTNVALFRGASIDTAPVQQAVYEYYDAHTDTGPGANGNKGDLMLAQIQDGANWNSSDPSTKGEGNVINTDYFRYEANRPGLLHYMFSNASFNRLSAAVGDPMSASDSQVSPYADVHLEFETVYGVRVATLELQGAGCSICGGGLGAYGYQYDYSTTQPSDHEFNMYTVKTTETLPDGSFNVVYSNWCGETLLQDHFVTEDGPHWITYYRYDSSGRILEIANPSGVIGYLPVTDGVRDTGELGVTLNSTGGEFKLFDYYAETTSTLDVTGTTTPTSTSATTPGGYNGYVEDTKLVHGDPASTTSTNVPILESYTRYFAVTAGLVSVAEVGDTSVYSTADSCPTATDPGTISGGKQTTSYAYTFYLGMVWAKYETTTLPDVSGTADEGSGVGASDQITSVFDSLGHEVWQKDARGFINYANYDPATGALLKTIQDVSTDSSHSDALHALTNYDLFPGWAMPTGGGLNLITTYRIDALGRAVEETDPKGNATFTVYIDHIDQSIHEVRVYRGWVDNGDGTYSQMTNAPPTEVMIEDMALPATITFTSAETTPPTSYTYDTTADGLTGSFTDTFTMTASPSSSTLNFVTLPVGGEDISGIRSLSRSISNEAGQLVETDDYYSLSGLAFAASGSAYLAYSPDANLFLPPSTVSDQPNNRGTKYLADGSNAATANYYVTTYAYGDTGQLDRVVNANGVIRRVAYDTLSRPTSTWIGTVDGDTATTDAWSPSFPNGGNMVQLTANVYDGGGVGDSNLTETVDFPSGSGSTSSSAVALFRVSETAYNWMDQPVTLKSGVAVTFSSTAVSGGMLIEGLGGWLVDSPSSEGASGDSTQRSITHIRLDNLGQVLEEDVFAGNGITLDRVSDSGISGLPSGDTKLRSEVAHTYDARGREYLTSVFTVSQTTGVAGGSAYATTHLYYDANDNLKQIVDPMSNYTTFTFDGVNRTLTRLNPNKSDGTASGAGLTSYTYATDGHVEVTDPNSHTSKYFYDAAARLVEMDQPSTDVLQSGTTDASASPTTTSITPKINYVYGDDGLLSTIRGQNSNQAGGTPYFTTYHHDALGRTTSIVSPQVNVLSAGSTNGSSTPGTPTSSFAYDGDSNVVTSTDANSGVASFAYDMFDNLAKVAPPGDSLTSSGPGKGAIYVFDNLGDQLSVQTADGTTGYSYNTLGQQYKITRPAIDVLQSDGTSHSGFNPVTSFTFDALGNLASSTDANANIPGGTPYSTAYYHDSLGRLTSVVMPNATGGSGAGPTTTYAYDLDNELTSVTDPLNNVTTIAYWRNGLKQSIRLPNPSNGSNSGGPLYQYDYTAGGQLYTVKDPFNNTTTYSYTSRDQLASVQLPNLTTGGSGGPVISFYHDANGNQTAEKDPDGNTTYYNFDPLNRLSDKREYVALKLDPTTSYTTQVDANVATSYLYDPAGNLTRVTDGDGHVIGYDYSGLNQRTAENWFADASASSPLNTISSTFFNGGELHTASSVAGTGGDSSHNSSYTFAYNQLGWLTSVDNNDPLSTGTAGVPRVKLNSQYDLNGNRTALAAQVDIGSGLKDDLQNTYMFDRLNQETQAVQQAATSTGHYAVGYKKTTFAYDAASRLQTLTDYKDSTTQAANGAFGYDHTNRLTDLSWTGYGGPLGSSGQFFDKFSWSYDSGSRVATLSNYFYTSENLSYRYDHDSQLTSAAASYGGYGGGVGGGTYGWDGNGDSTLSGRVTGKGNRLLSDGTYRFEYDNSGHMTKRTTIAGGAYTLYAYDNRGQMISVTDKNSTGTTLQTVALWYDVFNRLIGRTWTPYTSGVAGTPQGTRFVYDGDNAALAFNGNESLTDRYLWGPAVDQILVDERFAPSGSNWMPSSAGTTYFALGDNEWSVRDWITYGSLIDHVVYDSFGKVYSQSSTAVPFNFGHNGVFYDPAIGLEYHSRSSTGVPGRWYNPSIQRWMSEDPTGLAPDSDPYRYVGNSPTNFVDPSGLHIAFGNPTDIEIILRDGTTISGSSAGDLWNGLRNSNGMIDKIIIKGHGGGDRVLDGNNNSVITSGGNQITVVDGDGNHDITRILRDRTDKNSNITLRACGSDHLADNVAKALNNGAVVTGTHAGPLTDVPILHLIPIIGDSTFDIPWTSKVVDVDGWQNYSYSPDAPDGVLQALAKMRRGIKPNPPLDPWGRPYEPPPPKWWKPGS